MPTVASPQMAQDHPFLQKLLIKLRNSRFFTISLLLHLLIVVLLGSVVLFRAVAPPEDFTAGGGGGGGFVGPDNLPPGPPPASADLSQPDMQVTTPVVQTPSQVMDVLTTASTNPSAFSIDAAPVVAPSVNTSSVAQRIPSAAPGGGGGIQGLPGVMAGRGAGMRDRTRKSKGGTDKAEIAVLNGLRWLMRNQNADGTWGESNKGGISGLALLCFLGHGETYTSVEFGQTVKRAVDALIKAGEVADGRLNIGSTSFASNNAPYEHGIATYALAEAYTMTRDDRIVPVLTRAVAYIVQSQTKRGGWHYAYARGDENDMSVVGWQIQALKAAHLTGLGLPGVDKALDNSMGFLKSWQDPKTGLFGYQSPGGKLSLTGAGAVCLQYWTGRKGAEVQMAVRAILDGPPVDYAGAEADLYAWYYHTQACFQYGGASWDKWNKMFQDQLINAQTTDGSWPLTGGKGHGPEGAETLTGKVYRTTLCVLMLEVFYRFLPTGAQG